MVTNSIVIAALLLLPAVAGAAAPESPATQVTREAASPASCQAAATRPAIAGARTALDRNPADLAAVFALADAWSDAGCFNEAVQVLQSGRDQHPESSELTTRLRVARSLVGEQSYFEKLDRADAEAQLKRDTFRCTTLADLDACTEAVQMKPDDAALLVAQGDALLRAKRPADALGPYRRASALAPDQTGITQKIGAAQAQLPALQPLAPALTSRPQAHTASVIAAASPTHRYSNADPLAQSH